MNPFAATVTVKAEPISLRSLPLPIFLLFNALAVFVFPLACFVLVFVFWSNDSMFAAALGIFSFSHFVALWFGLLRYGHAVRVAIPSACAAIAIFSYNRHWIGQPDNSPFSDGIGTVDQHAFGVFAYYRVFDQPFADFGKTYTDWSALFANVELCVVVAILFAVVSWLLKRRTVHPNAA